MNLTTRGEAALRSSEEEDGARERRAEPLSRAARSALPAPLAPLREAVLRIARAFEINFSRGRGWIIARGRAREIVRTARKRRATLHVVRDDGDEKEANRNRDVGGEDHLRVCPRARGAS